MSATKIESPEVTTLVNAAQEEIYVKKRVMSLDFVKGLAIILIMLAHLGALWLDDDWVFVYGFILTYADFFGPGLFLLLSALSVVFSVKNKEGKVPEKAIRAGVFMRGGVLIMIGLLYNLASLAIIGKSVPFPLNLWGWNIITFIGFSQIFCYYALKLKPIVRVIISLGIIFISEWLRSFIYLNMDSNFILAILNFIITSPNASVTLFPWLALCFIGTIFGELLQEAIVDGSKEAYLNLYRQYMKWGAIFVVVAVFAILPSSFQFGWQLSTTDTLIGGIEEYPHVVLHDTINGNPFFYYDGMQNFLVRGTASNMFFLLGSNLLVIGLSFKIIDINGSENRFIDMLIFYGQASLSCFMIHHVFLPIFIRSLNLIFFIFVALAFLAFMGFLMYVWNKFMGGVGTFEWMMTQMGGGAKKKKA